ncbi:Proteasomal ATPase-associated factor 1 [Phytophthora citrophthora]|uniref:Proteasomal ATPase-associated factor 1 n=1 Tax=Phytophthora citrophthora TaxID=4793 RepID=A0AAD9LJR2_9STRA|nr:Proteasomal ATPase-associated factor 1 [Phytophthora citrophthora]
MKIEITASSSSDTQTYMQIQPDWAESGESCWLDVYERTVHSTASNSQELHQDERPNAKVISSPSSQYQLPLSDPSSGSETPHLVKILGRDATWIEVQADLKTNKHLRTVFQTPNDTVDVPDAKASDAADNAPQTLLQLHTVDVSKDERYVVVGGSDGVCMLWDSYNRAQMLPLNGHVMDVTSARFFPSSQVLLTGSLDFTLRIWSVQGRCAAVLKGHRGGVEDVAIVGKGRNVLSCGTDGLIQLWSVGTQEAIAKWANDDQSPVHCLSVMDDTAQLLAEGDYSPNMNEKEAETDEKVLFAGLDNGETLGVDIRARAAVLNLEGLAGSIISCAATTSTASLPMLFTGSEDGLLTVWDLRNTGAQCTRCCDAELLYTPCLEAPRRFTISPCQRPLEEFGLLMATEFAATGAVLAKLRSCLQNSLDRNTMLCAESLLPVKAVEFSVPVVTDACVSIFSNESACVERGEERFVWSINSNANENKNSY